MLKNQVFQLMWAKAEKLEVPSMCDYSLDLTASRPAAMFLNDGPPI